MRIEAIEDFHEFKDKGGILGKINVRIYFKYFHDSNEVVVVKAYKKEAEGKTPRHIVHVVQSRLRRYRSGELREGLVEFPPVPDEGEDR